MTAATEETIRETEWAAFTAAVSAAKSEGCRVTLMTASRDAFEARVERPTAAGQED